MPGAIEIHTLGLPVIPKLEPLPAEPRDLELLLSEVHALAIGFKQTAGLARDSGSLLSATQYVLRLLLEQGPKTVPQIARLRGTSRQNVQILVNRLRREGLVTLDTNPAHRRSAMVTLTQQGKSMQTSTANAQDALAHIVSSRCSQSEVRSAAALLRRLRESIAHLRNSESVTVAVSARPERVKAVQRSRPGNPPFIAGVEESSISAHQLPVSLL